VTTSVDNLARIWDTSTGELVISPLGHQGTVSWASFGPDGRTVLTASSDHTVRLWEIVKLVPLSVQRDKFPQIDPEQAFDPDRQRVIRISTEGTAQVWDTRTNRALTPVLTHGSAVLAVAFSADGRWVATASDDNSARVWEANTGQPVTPPLLHNSSVLAVAFSPDGHCLATGCDDRTIRVWEVATGLPITASLSQNWAVTGVAFSGDCCHLLALNAEGTTRAWACPVEDRPAEDLMLLAKLLAGDRIDEHGGYVPLDPKALEKVWRTLRSRYPASFRPSAAPASPGP
jgi:WD40 repeat protein